MKIIFISHTALGSSYVVGSHQLAIALANDGHEILHISSPLTLLHIFQSKYKFRRKLANLGPHEYCDGLLNWVPWTLVPWQFSRVLKIFLRLFGATIFNLRSTLRKLNFHSVDLVLIDEPRLVGLSDYFDNAQIVYRPTDIYWVQKNDASIINAERLLLSKVRLVVGTSGPVLQHVRSLGFEHATELIENGYEFNGEFTQQPDLQIPLKGIYYGSLDDRFDHKLILEIALANPSVNFVVASPDFEDPPKGLPANLQYEKGIPYNKLFNRISEFDFGFLPFVDSTANNGRSPMKLYEMYACGLPVFSTETTELRRRKLPFVFFFDSSLEIEKKLLELDTTILDCRFRETVLKNHTWSAISMRLLELVFTGKEILSDRKN